MRWNWQKDNWPNFTYDQTAMQDLESEFLRKAGVHSGAHRHLDKDDKRQFTINLLCSEILKTSEIEGQYLDRDSVQYSIRRHFGLELGRRKIPVAEKGISDMMLAAHRDFTKPLTHDLLFDWHRMLVSGRYDLDEIGRYRSHDDPMVIMSGRVDNPKIHFEAPPSKRVHQEMQQFILWFNQMGLPPLARASLAHLYFVCIHPFEDGNGRIGRALVEKALSQSKKSPALIALSQVIDRKRKTYYEALENNNKSLDVTGWIEYFSLTIIAAQDYSQQMVDFLIKKTKFFDRLRGQLNERQTKVILRMFEAGFDGFQGGLSAENYIAITQTSRATATRDLQDLVRKRALVKSGERKGTRYQLNIELAHSSTTNSTL